MTLPSAVFWHAFPCILQRHQDLNLTDYRKPHLTLKFSVQRKLQQLRLETMRIPLVFSLMLLHFYCRTNRLACQDTVYYNFFAWMIAATFLMNYIIQNEEFSSLGAITYYCKCPCTCSYMCFQILILTIRSVQLFSSNRVLFATLCFQRNATIF